jgi:sugar lactone lactonase YvrE
MEMRRSVAAICFTLAAAGAGAQNSPPYVFQPLAGALPEAGSVDGVGSAARFNGPNGVAVDGSGNIYVADTGNRTIRRIVPGNVVTTLAGLPGGSGTGDGSGPNAGFGRPMGLAVDAAGDILVADAGTRTIRKVTSGGAVTTIAGTPGSTGSADGPAASAKFVDPVAVTVDEAGNIYVLDGSSGVGLSTVLGNTVRKIALDGTVSTLAGTSGTAGSADGQGPAARFNYPEGIAVDGSGNIYVADTLNFTVRKVTPSGAVTTLAGMVGNSGSADGAGTTTTFEGPEGIAVDSAGNIFVGDGGNFTVRKVSPSGDTMTVAGTAGSSGSADGIAAAARFNTPAGLAVDASGDVYVADINNNSIRKIDASGLVSTVAGSAVTTGSADGFAQDASFNYPAYVAVDPSGNFFVTDTRNDTVRKITSAGVVTTFAGLAGQVGSADGTGAAARFDQPEGIAVDSGGNVFVADFLNRVIRKITPLGVVTTFAGQAGVFGHADGLGAAATFDDPAALAIDSQDNLYTADDYTIRKVSPAGMVTTIAGSPGAFGTTDGVGASASFNSPNGIAVDSTGNLYVTDVSGIRKVAPAGVVTTVPGSSQLANGNGIAIDREGNLFVTPFGVSELKPDGTLSVTGNLPFGDLPSGIAVDPSGNLIVTDVGSNQIVVGSPGAPDARIANLSCRAVAGSGPDTLIVGFVVAGGAKGILARGIGPSLAGFGVQGYMPSASIGVFSGQSLVASNAGWSTAPDEQDIVTVSSAVGAFSLQAGSLDSALLANVQGGSYTIQVTGPTAGVALAEVYDTDPSPSPARLINVSARAGIGTGSSIAIAGFVVQGHSSEKVLIRGVGPGLAAFGVGGTLAKPRIQVFSGGTLIASNTGWTADPSAAVIPSETAQVGAFQLAQDGSDDALLLTLRPGAYTAQLSGADGGSGIGLIEIYEVQ